MMILDGHQIRLDPTFINYINDDGHPWKICLGVPYATVLWQVGDALEQNRKFKTKWYNAKLKLMEFKFDHDLPQYISPTDIMPLLNHILHDWYGNKKNNLKATANRGWYPANWKLVDHPSLLVYCHSILSLHPDRKE